jgi:hypothetical protein
MLSNLYVAIPPCGNPAIIISDEVVSYLDLSIWLFSLKAEGGQRPQVFPNLHSTVIECLPEKVIPREKKSFLRIFNNIKRTASHYHPDCFHPVHQFILKKFLAGKDIDQPPEQKASFSCACVMIESAAMK